MLARTLEPEVMDTPADALQYDMMDHSAVNKAFAADFVALRPLSTELVLDVGTGTALIPVEIARFAPHVEVHAVDAAEAMLALAAKHVDRENLAGRVNLRRATAQSLPFDDGFFDAVISNSLMHHLPEPSLALAEMLRVCKPGGVLFVRDLVRPPDAAALQGLVDRYAGHETEPQRKLFADSLAAALTLDEVRELVAPLGFDPAGVTLTSDRHWTWAAVRG